MFGLVGCCPVSGDQFCEEGLDPVPRPRAGWRAATVLGSALVSSSTIRSSRSARPDRVAAIDSAISGMSLCVPVRSGGEEVRDRLSRGEVLNQRVEQRGHASEPAVQRRGRPRPGRRSRLSTAPPAPRQPRGGRPTPRACLRRRGIAATIPVNADQQAHRRCRACRAAPRLKMRPPRRRGLWCRGCAARRCRRGDPLRE